jgi:hypothetical protein
LRARLERLLAAHGRPDARARAAALREALIEAKVGVRQGREGIARTERGLEAERRQLGDAERRGRLAAQVSDAETVSVAARFAEKHRERIAVLERKLLVQREELAIAERDLEEIARELRAGGRVEADASVRAAWRDVEAAGGVRPDTDLDGELLKAEAERRRMEAAVEQQLAHLKKKLGRD